MGGVVYTAAVWFAGLPLYCSTPVVVVMCTVLWWWREGNTARKHAQPQNLNKRSEKERLESKKMAKNVIEDGGTGERDEDYTGDDLVPPAIPDDVQHVPYLHNRRTLEDSYSRSKQFYELMNQRRSVRFFSKERVPKEVIENIIRTAGTAPSGAHTEPWRFVAVRDPDYKEKIRDVVEQEEEINYLKRMGDQWTSDLKGIGTTHVKEYLTDVPWILLVFKQPYEALPDGRKRNNYYHEISTALSGGLLLAAIQDAGLVTLTSTPMNCGPALKSLLGRPSHEKLLLLMPVGFPAKTCTVPDIKRKELQDILTIV